MSATKLIPELLFPEFVKEGEWEKKALKSVSEVIMGSSPSSSSYNENKIGLPLLQGNADIKNRLSSPRIYTSEVTKECEIDDILLSVRAPVGTVAKSVHKACIGRGISALRAINQNSQEYLYQWLFSYESSWQNISQGGTFDAVNSDDIKNLLLPIPKLNEQQKIASCLSSLDEVIAAHCQKLDALKHHKKGLMQNLFPNSLNYDSYDGMITLIDENPKNKKSSHQINQINQSSDNLPKWRFPEFVKDGEWVEKTLDEVATFLKGKGISKSDIFKNGNLPCIRYGELYTHYKETIGIIKSYTNLSADDLVLSQANDVIIPASGETQTDIATASCVLKKGIALGGDLNIIRTKINGVFLSYYLNNIKRMDIAQMAQGISVVHLYPNQLKTLIINIPKPKEQQKIASCLSSLDALITTQAEKIEALKLHKKGLMQGLFPKMSEL